MKVSELRYHTDSLSKFATTREQSVGANTLIGVQVRDDLKLIAGTSQAGVVTTIPSGSFSSTGVASFTIPARPLLQAVKVLPAKADIQLSVTEDTLTIIAEGGGKIDVKQNGDMRIAGFARKPKEFTAKGVISGDCWKQMSKLFKKVASKIEVPSVQVIDGTGYATVAAPGNRPMYVSVQFPSEGPSDYNMSAYRSFWDALVALEGDGELLWGKAGVLARAGDTEIFSAPYLVSRYDSETKTAALPSETKGWPIMRLAKVPEVTFSMPKKDLHIIVKGQAPFDEHNRVTLEVKPDRLKVTPFGAEQGQEVPCETMGLGIRSVNADYLNGLLSSMDTKEVTLGWGSGQPAIALVAKEYGSWTILLAPIVL